MNVHAVVSDLLGAWALDACDDAETASVEEHLGQCLTCASEARRLRTAASWLGVDAVAPVPVSLRSATLARARAVRPPNPGPTLVEAYAGQVARLARLLDTISIDDWERADPRHGTVAGVIGHLADNDRMLADDLLLRVPVGPEVRGRWRGQADALVRALAHEDDLDQHVRMAGRGDPGRRPLRDAIVQRAFETWIHHDDVAGVVGRPGRTPPPEQIRRIVDLAVRLLPAALEAGDVRRPGMVGRIVLTGPAGDEWSFPLGEPEPGHPGPSTVSFTVTLDATDFARLVANRRTPETLDYRVSGDPVLAATVLRVAATLGCD